MSLLEAHRTTHQISRAPSSRCAVEASTNCAKRPLPKILMLLSTARSRFVPCLHWRQESNSGSESQSTLHSASQSTSRPVAPVVIIYTLFNRSTNVIVPQPSRVDVVLPWERQVYDRVSACRCDESHRSRPPSGHYPPLNGENVRMSFLASIYFCRMRTRCIAVTIHPLPTLSAEPAT